jgi:hypothetical protein
VLSIFAPSTENNSEEKKSFLAKGTVVVLDKPRKYIENGRVPNASHAVNKTIRNGTEINQLTDGGMRRNCVGGDLNLNLLM